MTKKMTIGRYTLGAWKDRSGWRLDGGRVLYHRAKKLWCRIGLLTLFVERAEGNSRGE